MKILMNRSRAIGVMAASAAIAVLSIGTFAQGQRPQYGNAEREGTPVKQNPNVNRPLANDPGGSGGDSRLQSVAQQLVGAYGIVATSNDGRNPYKRIEPWGELPTGVKQWPAVIGAEAGPDGNLVVLGRCFEDRCVNRPEAPLMRFNPKTGKLLNSWGVGLFNYPHGLHVANDNSIWTADVGSHVVRKFSPDGKLLMTIGTPGVEGSGTEQDAPTVLRQPTDVIVSSTGTVFITEGHNKNDRSRVSKYSPDGKLIKRMGSLGSAHNQLADPHCICMDNAGRLWIGDRSNNRMMVWDQDGNYIDHTFKLGRPSGCYISQDNTIYVADSESWGRDNPGFKKGIRIGKFIDGLLQVQSFIQDIESMDNTHSGAEGVGLDLDGNVYGGVVRRRMLERHEPPAPIPTRNAAWGK